MEKQLVDDATSTKEKIVLELFGIDKKWVWTPAQKWVDMKEIIVNETHLEQISHRKWWQFWKK